MPVRWGTAIPDMASQAINYIPQVLQPVAPQLAQELPPTGEGTPLSSLEKQAKVDNTRLALLWQRGQEAPSVAWLNGRNSSNLSSQLEQTYSYIGISCLL